MIFHIDLQGGVLTPPFFARKVLGHGKGARAACRPPLHPTGRGRFPRYVVSAGMSPRRGQDPALRTGANGIFLWCALRQAAAVKIAANGIFLWYVFRQAVGAACMPPAGVTGGNAVLRDGDSFPVAVGRGLDPAVERFL